MFSKFFKYCRLFTTQVNQAEREQTEQASVSSVYVPHQQSNDGWIDFYSADSLLNTPYRKLLIKLIWDRVSMDQERFNLIYLTPINKFAELVQLLPASESHHHAYLGGLLDHTLEVINYALKIRLSYLLPLGGQPEDISHQSEAWSAGVIYGALLHDIGKILVDIKIEKQTGEIWSPINGPVLGKYRFMYNRDRKYELHNCASSFFLNVLIPQESIVLFSSYPELFSSFIYFCSGHYEKSGVIGEIVLKADTASVSKNLGGDPTKVAYKTVISLTDKILGAIRYLIDNELKLNGTGACDGWYDGNVWVISKVLTDKIRAYLLKNGITEIPSDNLKMFDILRESGLAIATDDNKTVWTCKIESDSGWVAEKLTLIKLSSNVAFSSADKQPELFLGKITPITLNSKNDSLQEQSSQRQLESESSEKQLEINEELTVGYVTNLLFNNSDSSEIDDNDNSVTGGNRIEIDDTAFNDNFIKWVREQILNRKLAVNTQTANIHTVNNRIFMVTPGIFQKYCLYHFGNSDTENWKKIQSNFQSLKIHSKFGKERFNIWKCLITSKKKNKKITGYLIEKKYLFAIPDEFPNNPHLELILDEDEYSKK